MMPLSTETSTENRGEGRNPHNSATSSRSAISGTASAVTATTSRNLNDFRPFRDAGIRAPRGTFRRVCGAAIHRNIHRSADDDYPPLESGEFAPLAGLARAGMWTVAA